MDPNLPAVKRIIAFAQEIWSRTIETKTPEQLDELNRKAEENRLMRQMMYAGRIHPVTETNRSEEDL